jgi:hypothetical protein
MNRPLHVCMHGCVISVKPFHMCFTHAIQRCIFWRFWKKLAILIYFHGAPAISMIILDAFWVSFVLIEIDFFDLFQFISIPTSKWPKHFNGMLAISIVMRKTINLKETRGNNMSCTTEDTVYIIPGIISWPPSLWRWCHGGCRSSFMIDT